MPEKLSVAQERYFLDTFPLVRRLATRRLSVICQDAAEDIAQKVMLKLWGWKQRRPESNLSETEWQKLANTAAQNEIKNYYADKSRREILLSEVKNEDDFGTMGGGNKSNYSQKRNADWQPAANAIEGNCESEVGSLLGQMWKTILILSLREKYALLFKNREILNRLFAHRCCNIGEATASLELNRDEFLEIYRSLPLSDQEISQILERKIKEQVTSENVLKARQRAKAKIRRHLSSLDFHERTSITEKT